jgi:hypothetical protein
VTPALLFPAGLAGLAALLVPLLIHLARRTEAVPTDFAALRWLRQKPRPRHRPRFDERLLLAVRLLLLALIALWLARPVLTGAPSRAAVTAVVPGVPPVEGALWLAPGFPPVTEPAPAGPVAVASLVRELDATLPPGTPLTVRVPAVIAGADAERPRVARTVRWDVAPGRMAARAAAPSRMMSLAVRDGGLAGARYLAAAARAFGGTDVGGPEAPLPRAGALAWFVPGELPGAVRDWVAQGNVVLLPVTASLTDAATVWRDAQGQAVAEAAPLGRGRLVRFVRPLVPAALPALLEPDFPDRLAAVIATPTPEPDRVAARDYAPVPGAPAPSAKVARTDLRPWLAVLIALVFLAERWLATRRVRVVAA